MKLKAKVIIKWLLISASSVVVIVGLFMTIFYKMTISSYPSKEKIEEINEENNNTLKIPNALLEIDINEIGTSYQNFPSIKNIESNFPEKKVREYNLQNNKFKTKLLIDEVDKIIELNCKHIKSNDKSSIMTIQQIFGQLKSFYGQNFKIYRSFNNYMNLEEYIIYWEIGSNLVRFQVFGKDKQFREDLFNLDFYINRSIPNSIDGNDITKQGAKIIGLESNF